MTKLYEIYTENKPNLVTLISKYFKGATLLNGDGLYKHELEHCTVIRIITGNTFKVKMLAQEIKIINHQTEILVTETKIDLTVVK